MLEPFLHLCKIHNSSEIVCTYTPLFRMEMVFYVSCEFQSQWKEQWERKKRTKEQMLLTKWKKSFSMVCLISFVSFLLFPIFLNRRSQVHASNEIGLCEISHFHFHSHKWLESNFFSQLITIYLRAQSVQFHIFLISPFMLFCAEIKKSIEIKFATDHKNFRFLSDGEKKQYIGFKWARSFGELKKKKKI